MFSLLLKRTSCDQKVELPVIWDALTLLRPRSATSLYWGLHVAPNAWWIMPNLCCNRSSRNVCFIISGFHVTLTLLLGIIDKNIYGFPPVSRQQPLHYRGGLMDKFICYCRVQPHSYLGDNTIIWTAWQRYLLQRDLASCDSRKYFALMICILFCFLNQRQRRKTIMLWVKEIEYKYFWIHRT